MSTLRIAGLAGTLVVAALVGGTIIGSVAATTLQATTPSSAGGPAGSTFIAVSAASAAPAGAKAAEYCADFRRAFAANLGVDVSALAPAAKAAALATIDAAVADGTMPKARAGRTAMKRIVIKNSSRHNPIRVRS